METKKLLAIGIIFLFIGVAVAPSINSTGYQTVYASDNRPPNDPTITGPRKGKVGATYLFNFWTTDPENQNVSYYIEWGDGTHTGWTDYFTSGQTVHFMHTWYKINEYPVRCKAKDTLGAESNWSYMPIPIFDDASDNNDLVEVTSQACGIQGFGNTTVKLTKQQYHGLEQYLFDFRARLNQTSTREEAVPIFKNAVVELNKYGLLPKGMSVEKAQKLVTGEYLPKWERQLVARLGKNYLSNSTNESYFCLVYGSGSYSNVRIPYVIGENVISGFTYRLAGYLLFNYDTPILFFILLFPLWVIGTFFVCCFNVLDVVHDINPLHFLSTIEIYGSTTVLSLGINGIKHWQGNLIGDIFGSSLHKYIVGPFSDYSKPCYPGIMGFTGFSVTMGGYHPFIGAALIAKITSV